MTTAITLLALAAVVALINILANRLAAHIHGARFQHRLNCWRWPAKGE